MNLSDAFRRIFGFILTGQDYERALKGNADEVALLKYSDGDAPEIQGVTLIVGGSDDAQSLKEKLQGDGYHAMACHDLSVAEYFLDENPCFFRDVVIDARYFSCAMLSGFLENLNYLGLDHRVILQIPFPLSADRACPDILRMTDIARIPLGFRALKVALDRPGWIPNAGGPEPFTPETVSAREGAG